MWRWLGIVLLVLLATMPVAVQASTVQTSATIDSLTPACSGISVGGTGSYQQSISKVAFVLADVSDVYHVRIVDSKEFPNKQAITEAGYGKLGFHGCTVVRYQLPRSVSGVGQTGPIFRPIFGSV